MARKLSTIAPDWWDYTTLDADLVSEAARLTPKDLLKLARPGFQVAIYPTPEEFYCAEALEYIAAWRRSTDDNPVGVCGPIGPTEHLPLVARMVNAMGLDVRSAHFWGMDEWVDAGTGREVPATHPLSFEKCDRDLCFSRIDRRLRMTDSHLHFPKADTTVYRRTWGSGVHCALMQGGQGDVKHWAFNDPQPRRGKWRNEPPPAAEIRKLGTRVVDLHPLTLAQNARTSAGGNLSLVPTKAVTVGPAETWLAETVSIWHPGHHDNAFGMRLTALMISRRIVDTAVPMSLLADHPNVRFSYLAGGIGTCSIDMH